MSNTFAKHSPPEDPWLSVTWEGSEQLQLRRQRDLSLRDKILALEGMAEVARRLAAGTEARRGADTSKTGGNTAR